MKIKTNNLDGLALDWAVAKARGFTPRIEFQPMVKPRPIAICIPLVGRWVTFPARTWDMAGTIQQQWEISVDYGRAEFTHPWIAYKLGLPYEDNPQSGPTPMIAILRCFVDFRLGDEVEIPDELATS